MQPYRCDSALGGLLAIIDISMSYGGPCFIALGMSLILGVSCLWLTAIFMPVYASRDWVTAAAHLMLGAVLLGNVLFNYIMCIITSPGTTLTAVKEVCMHATADHKEQGQRIAYTADTTTWTSTDWSCRERFALLAE